MSLKRHLHWKDNETQMKLLIKYSFIYFELFHCYKKSAIYHMSCSQYWYIEWVPISVSNDDWYGKTGVDNVPKGELLFSQYVSALFNIFSPTMYKVLKNIILSVFFVHLSLSFCLNMYWKPIGYICHNISVFFNTFLYFSSDWLLAVIDAAEDLFKKKTLLF